jgi:hypothetical protein
MVTISLQVPAELKSRLQAQALQSGRTLSQEAQWRLERSLDPDALWQDAFLAVTEKALGDAQKAARARRQQALQGMTRALRTLAEELGQRIEEFQTRPKGKGDE